MSDLAAGFNTLAASAISVGSMAALESDVLVVTQTSTLFSSTWPTAALAMFFPTLIEQPLLVTQMTHVNGGTLAGNVDVGVYDRFGNLLVSKGGVAQAGASTIQAHDLTDTLLVPGFYYRAIVFSLAPRRGRGTACRSSSRLRRCCSSRRVDISSGSLTPRRPRTMCGVRAASVRTGCGSTGASSRRRRCRCRSRR
jgi:hypothetical protein